MTMSVVNIGQHPWLEEAAAPGGALAAGRHLDAFLHGIGDARLNLCERRQVAGAVPTAFLNAREKAASNS